MDRALIVKPEQRTQSIDDLRHDLGMAASDPDPAKVERRSRSPNTVSGNLPAGAAVARKSRTGVFAAVGVVVLLIIAGAVYALRGSKPPSPPTVASTSATPAVTTPAAPVEAASPVVAAPTTPATPTERATPVQAATVGPFDPAREFERVASAQSPDYKVEAAADKPQLRINKDKMTFKVKTEKAGHLYVLMHGTDGAIIQIFPNTEAKNNQIRADTTLSLPSGKGNWDISVGGPAGVDHLIAIVSKFPRDFSGLGLKLRDGFAQTTVEEASAAAKAQGAGASIFAGRPVCQQPCTDDYGAALFTAEEIN